MNGFNDLESWLTPQAHTNLLGRLASLEAALIQAEVDVAESQPYGMTGENTQLDAALEAQRQIMVRIQVTKDRLANVRIRDSYEFTCVEPGALVTVEWADGEVETLMFGSIENRPEDMWVVTPSSPLGSKLGGRSVGDVVEFVSPRGVKSMVTVRGIDAPTA